MQLILWLTLELYNYLSKRVVEYYAGRNWWINNSCNKMMDIKDLNQKLIERYLSVPLDLRTNSSYPFLIDFKTNQDIYNVPIYFKQPQHWLSYFYDYELDPDKLYELLMREYKENLLINSEYRPIALFKTYQDRLIKENRNINLIYNNIIKFSKRSDPNSYDGILSDKFNDLVEEEYKVIRPLRSVFCVGPGDDYSGMMSWKMLNDIEIVKLTVERPYNLYKDILGNEVLHTYHPGYWFDISIDLEDIVYRFIVGGAVNI